MTAHEVLSPTLTAMGALRIFFLGVSNEGVWRTEVPQQGPGAAPRWGPGAKPAEAGDILAKWCINTSSTEVSDNICSKKKTLFNISGSGGGQLPPPPPCPCTRTPMMSVQYVILSYIMHTSACFTSPRCRLQYNVERSVLRCRCSLHPWFYQGERILPHHINIL